MHSADLLNKITLHNQHTRTLIVGVSALDEVLCARYHVGTC